ncbi:iron transporter [Candidatus Falkowbacteria bacterium CG10_big_fil_rev_8_21_14_0_10_39_9]|uniref:Iron transporter n=1 Tax=Candidatus Falkowbacteria bacterium CG10_big_fil_rev_8_21_14_0_10_39_9 TaxID=1974566 RepID=A0A2M6WQ68_9BACT|nr:MAG: iron transporter [Candidatus Falkowbacteria bacterium CG10_big_fil_rev_8_21_14_0_10_39_9]
MFKFRKKLKNFFKVIGPGVVTGAADDDPSGIATYTQTGAQFGYGQLWTALLTLPFLTATQEACARIGAVTGKGLAANIKEHYNKKVLFADVLLVFLANTINIGADIGAMASAAQLIISINFAILTLGFTVLILVLEIFISYRKYSKILKWLVLAFLSYPITLFMIHQPWATIARATLIPNIEISFAFFFIITGVIGTTISPYMFFWESSQEVEELKAKHLYKILGMPRGLKNFLRSLRWDNLFGMLLSQFTTWSIIIVAATVLNQNGITNIGTAADAARSLEPLVSGFSNAGLIAKSIFAIGVIGLGLLAVPVLSGSASYALSEAMSWREGLNLKLKRAHGFYGVITIATLIGLMINFIGIDPIRALVFTAVFNGVVSVPLLFLIAKIARSEKIMGNYRSGQISNILVWSTFGIMSASAIAMFITLVQG